MISVVICGPESTGKSTLTRQLSEHFHTFEQVEYARSYVERLNRKYNFHDVETIAIRQCAQFKRRLQIANSNQLVFFDTFLIVTKVWFQEVYGICPIWLHHSIQTFKPNLVLLCYPDLEWQHDGVRENESKRKYLFDLYRHELAYYHIDYKLVDGFGKERLIKAISHINDWLNVNQNSKL